MIFVRMSARLLADAQLHVSFSFPSFYFFLSPFIGIRNWKKYTRSFDRNFLRRDRCSLKLRRGPYREIPRETKKMNAIPGRSSELVSKIK